MPTDHILKVKVKLSDESGAFMAKLEDLGETLRRHSELAHRAGLAAFAAAEAAEELGSCLESMRVDIAKPSADLPQPENGGESDDLTP